MEGLTNEMFDEDKGIAGTFVNGNIKKSKIVKPNNLNITFFIMAMTFFRA
jgi:hypothetical protein